MKRVKVLETGNLPEELWEIAKECFEGGDTTVYFISDNKDEMNILDEYLLEQGCSLGEKIVVERGTW